MVVRVDRRVRMKSAYLSTPRKPRLSPKWVLTPHHPNEERQPTRLQWVGGNESRASRGGSGSEEES